MCAATNVCATALDCKWHRLNSVLFASGFAQKFAIGTFPIDGRTGSLVQKRAWCCRESVQASGALRGRSHVRNRGRALWEDVPSSERPRGSAVTDQECMPITCLPNIWKKFGINPASRFYEIYGAHIEARLGSPDLTFAQVQRVRHTGAAPTFTCTCDGCKVLCLVYLSFA